MLGYFAKLPALAAVALFIGGCGPTAQQWRAERAVQAYYLSDYRAAALELAPLAREPNEDFVLNNVRLGSAAMADANLDEAETAFLRAYEVINSYGVNNGGRTAGAVLVSESLKIWKGEPFERAMAHFYLGVIYYTRHDYENSRAALENAIFKLRDYADSDAKGEEFHDVENTFVVAFMMLGKCWQKLGRDDLARANFARVAELSSVLAPAADFERNAKSNVLLVIDYGHGPRKLRTLDGTFAGFGPLPRQAGPIPRPHVRVDGQPFATSTLDYPPIDLLAMAQERRWQSMDTIRTIKSVVGTGLMAAGAYEGVKRKPDYGAAAGLLAAGVLLKATSQADVRQWEMLPRTVFVLPLRLKPGRHDVTVEFPGPDGGSQTWRGIVAPQAGEDTYYYRVARGTHLARTWPAAGNGADGQADAGIGP